MQAIVPPCVIGYWYSAEKLRLLVPEAKLLHGPRMLSTAVVTLVGVALTIFGKRRIPPPLGVIAEK
jgi:hypothetical protein